jgi:hypothetical protein
MTGLMWAVATIDRLLISFATYRSLLMDSFAKETYI